MKQVAKFGLLIILGISLTNCSSVSFFTLNPDEEATLNMGRMVVEKEDQFAYSSLNFEEQIDGDFNFFLYVQNKNDEEILLDPKDIYIKAYDKNKKLLNDNKIYAVDPEAKIEHLNKDISERESDHKVTTGLNVVFSLFSTIVALADDNDNDAEEIMENVSVAANNQINENISCKNDINNLESQKSYWKNEALRKTQLSNNEEISGTIYIPIIPNAEYIKVIIPLGKTIHTYKFKQALVQ
jgi:hypothetical protein